MAEIPVEIKEVEIVRVNLIDKEIVEVKIAMPGQGGVTSVPPGNHYRVTNIWVNQNTGKLHVEYEVA